jgi:hypothetical protein
MKKNTVLLLFIVLISSFLVAKDFDIELQGKGNLVQVLRNDYLNLSLSFHFEGINHINVETGKGIFSELIIPQTYATGDLGTPKLPAAKKLIEIPFGAEMNIRVVNYDVTEYKLADYGIYHPLMPVQPSLAKNVDPATVKFEYQEKVYQQNSFVRSQLATVEALGTLRGMRLARVEIAPVEYNPVAGTIRVYTDVQIEIDFNGVDYARTEFVKKATASPYFSVISNQILNSRNVYDDHPDLLKYPVKYLLVYHPMFEAQLQPFIDWKIKKGFHVIAVSTSVTGTSFAQIQTWIHGQYNSATPENPAPSFILLVGDTAQVPAQQGSSSQKMTDLYYASVDGDYFPDMYYGRLSATNTTQLQNQLNKILSYEKYEFADPTYLDNVTLIAGEDGTWNPRVGQPTIQYGTQNYFNTAHGFATINTYLTSYAGCYNTVNGGLGFINYTAHGSETSWAGPVLNQAQVNAFTNVGKPTFAIGNCCLAADFGYAECFGETWLRASNGAVGYIGSSPSSYWFEDFYWSVGAFPIVGNNNGYVPSYAETTWGAYDGAFVSNYNVMGSTFFVGNLAVTEVDIQNYPQHSSPLYYWQAYNLLGDPSVFPYYTQAEVNTVSYMDVLPIGLDFFEVAALPGSYVAISYNGVLKGTAIVPQSGPGSVVVPIEPIYDSGMADIVVTGYGLQPYISQVLVAPLDGPYVTIHAVSVNAGNDNIIEFGETVHLTVSLRNVGVEAATGVQMAITVNNQFITLLDGTETVGTIMPDQIVTFTNAFQFNVANSVPNGHPILFNVTITGNQGVWYNTIPLTAYAPVLAISNVAVNDDANNMLDPGDRAFINVTVTNNGGAKAHNLNALLSTQSNLISFNDNSDTAAMIAAGGSATFMFDVDVSESANIGDTVQFTLNTTADNNYAMSGNFALTIGLIFEDFESGDFTQKPWEFSGNLPWVIATDAYAGSYAAKSGAISHSQTSTIFVELYVTQADEISFWKKVSSEGNYDFLKFYINNQEMGSWSGDVAWAQHTYPVAVGSTIFKWTYSKDGSVSTGSDCAWLDEIIFPPCIVPQPATLVYTPEFFNVSLNVNDSTTRTLSLSNTGDLDLTYSIAIQNTTEEGRNLTGSTVSCNAEGFVPGENVTWTFSVTCVSNDNEWIKDLWIVFPAGVLVNSSTNLIGGSGGAIPTDNVTGDGVTIHWGGAGYMANGQTATANVNVSISSGFAGDITLPWTIHGDEWGQPPHTIEGVIGIPSLGEPLTWLTLSSVSGVLGAQQTHTIQVVFNTADMDFGTYTANLVIQHNAGENVIIPVTLTVGEVSNDHVLLPSVTVLEGNYPNPFNPSTTIKFDLHKNSHVELTVYNLKGQKVTTLVNNGLNAGHHNIFWDGKDYSNRQISSGIYLYRFTSINDDGGRYTSTRKMILMK